MMFYVLLRCHVCDNDMYYGPCGAFLDSYRGYPVVAGDVIEQAYVECDRCRSGHEFGELDVLVHEGDRYAPSPLDDAEEDDGDD